jgi:release factor glutamine methyltransferase
VNIRDALEAARRKLADCSLAASSPRLEVELLMVRVLETTRSFLFAHPEQELPARQAGEFRALLQRRLRGEPLAYVLGEREFWSMNLQVSPAVLIPRPETEGLVSLALGLLRPGDKPRVADLGTGSGAIALALARERPAAEVHATDISDEALAIARGNAARLGIANVDFHYGSWCQPLSGRFDLIASNPPYVSGRDPHLDQGDCRFEPRLALTPGGDGLAAIRAIAREAPARLATNGWLLLEHGHDQGPAVRALLMAQGYRDIDTVEDLQGLERITSARSAGEPA